MRPSMILVNFAILAMSLPVVAQTSGKTQMHPQFEVFDVMGESVAQSGGQPDAQRTCGICHDVAFISNHDLHKHAQADCFTCHVENSDNWTLGAFAPDGKLRSEMIGVGSANDGVCATCHGLVPVQGEPVALPDDLMNPPKGIYTAQPYDLTRQTGAIFSGETIARSYLNLENKETLNYPWDVHAQRLVKCRDCHHAANNPSKAITKTSKLPYLKRDPRLPTISNYLSQPDHRLTKDKCESCHNPTAVHDFLPQRERHFKVLACQSCHVPHIYGPAIKWEDATVVTLKGAPVYTFQGFEENETIINGRFGKGFVPSLFPFKDTDGEMRVGPFNFMVRWYWVDDEDGTRVPAKVVRAAYLDGESYTDSAIAALDDNGDGMLTREELYLQSDKAVSFVTKRLKNLGIGQPVIRGTVDAHPIAHGVTNGSAVVRECASCHAVDSRLTGDIVLSDRFPGGVIPEPGTGLLTVIGGVLEKDSASENLTLRRDDKFNDLYVFGQVRVDWLERLGMALFFLVVIVLIMHGGYRILTRSKRQKHALPVQRVYMYRGYERVWHWLMAASIIGLMITGFEIHYPDALSLLGFRVAVTVHNVIALVMIINAFLSLFYHLASNDIRQFIPQRRGLLRLLMAQAKYYAGGIFLGRPHPVNKSMERKLNPLQQLTYLGLLNILFPLQVLTGVLMWISSRRPDLLDAVGGFAYVAQAHYFGSWLFLTFLVMHVYLTTTGHTPLSNIRAMIDGYDDIEVHTESADAPGENNV